MRLEAGKMQTTRLREALEALYAACDHKGRAAYDPVRFLHRCADPRDIEVIGLLAASLAYGNAKAASDALERLLAVLGPRPHRALLRFDPRQAIKPFDGLYYRLSTGRDLAAFCFLIGQALRKHGSLGDLFLHGYREEEQDLLPSLGRFVRALLGGDTKAVYGRSASNRLPQGLRHLLPDPSNGGANKRLLLYLRWMVRPPAEGVDFGLWPLPPAKLLLPLDTHVIRIGRYLGLADRKTVDAKLAREMTEALRRLAPEDPARYDFALCHHGMSGACPARPTRAHCLPCPLRPACRVGRRYRSEF
ncbi:MAG: TIGR02757 family protein [Nitrospirae bacterium]|nr:TIGR02757 family protein [Nitrospirota bacterium]